MEYFSYGFRHQGVVRYVLWFGGEVDGVLTNDRQLILIFDSVQSAALYAAEHDLPYSISSSQVLELDWIAEGGSCIEENGIDCKKALEAWNFFADISSSLPEKAIDFPSKDRKPSETYDKLFWGNNLPAVTPDGEHYEPTWSPEELEEIRSILVSGLKLFSGNLEDTTVDRPINL